MNRENLIQCLKYGEASIIEHEELKELCRKYPWFGAAHFALLRIEQNKNKEWQQNQELCNNWLRIPNAIQLCRVMAGQDIFNEKRECVTERLEFATSPVYKLEEEGCDKVNSESKEQDLIDKFLNNELPEPVAAQTKAEDTEKEEYDDVCFTETLAKIYVDQGLYEKAMTTYFKLSLKIPEKSSYFAAQIEKIKQLNK